MSLAIKVYGHGPGPATGDFLTPLWLGSSLGAVFRHEVYKELIGIGSIGGGEVMLILVVALLLFGPRKIPEIGRTLGKTMAEFRKATRDFKLNLEREVDMEDIGKAGSEIRKARDEMRSVARDAMNLSPVSSDPPEASRDQGSDDGNDRKD